jgi:DNA-binding XRE family transcriptional regulator
MGVIPQQIHYGVNQGWIRARPFAKYGSTMNKTETIGERLVRLRKTKALNQRQLARAIGVSVATLRNWEHDRRFPNFFPGSRLAQAFGISPDDLVAHLTGAELRRGNSKRRK